MDKVDSKKSQKEMLEIQNTVAEMKSPWMHLLVDWAQPRRESLNFWSPQQK
jgi:hypothetical protein